MEKNQLSKTAAFVAIKFYGLTQWKNYRSAFDTSTMDFYDHLVRSLPGALAIYHKLLRNDPVRSLLFWSNEFLLPGDLMHILSRKWYLEKMLDLEIDNGVKQVVVLGSGFDHLAWRSSRKNINSVEIDVPGMADLKRRFYDMQYPGVENPTVISGFVPETLISNSLHQHQIDPNIKTVIVAEGFFDYLEKDSVSNLLADIYSYFDEKPNLLSTHFALDELSWFHSFIFQNSIRLVGEYLKLNLDISSFESLLKEQNLIITDLYSHKTIEDHLWTNLKIKQKVLNGFYLLSAEYKS